MIISCKFIIKYHILITILASFLSDFQLFALDLSLPSILFEGSSNQIEKFYDFHKTEEKNELLMFAYLIRPSFI